MNFYNEHDRHAAAWLRELIKAGLIAPGIVDERDIQEIRADDLKGFTQCHFFGGVGGWSYALRLAGWPDDRFIWTGSAPCQPFTPGPGKGMQDDRDLWPVFARLICKSRPSIVIGEQVSRAIAFGWLDRLCDDLEVEDYAIGSAVLPACAAKSPQSRPRLYWAAHDTRQRQSESRKHREIERDSSQDSFGEASGLVDAVRRSALPFMCRRHDGVSRDMAAIAIKGFGNAIVPQLAAEFIRAFMEVEAIP